MRPSKRLHTSDASGELPSNEGEDETEQASCARTDAKATDRDVMMKFDIAKNEEGPLRRTLTVEVKGEKHISTDERADGSSVITATQHPGLDERLKNLETHLAMRYGTFVSSHYWAPSYVVCTSTVTSSVTAPSYQMRRRTYHPT